MGRKDFTQGLDILIPKTVLKNRTADNKKKKTAGKSSSKTAGESKPKEKIRGVRATFIVREDLLLKAKALAYWDRKLIKDVINKALDEYLSSRGEIKDIPKGDD